jgi:hypothetical protein
VDDADRYWKLRPMGATPEDETCRCTDRVPLVLQYHLSENPLACARCNGEVSPEQIGFTAEVAEMVATWRELEAALFAMELESSEEYEQWAQRRLVDPNSRVNQLGLQVVARLNQYCRTYYWWFLDEEARNGPPPARCPRCSGQLAPLFVHLVCETCSILVPDR